MQQTIITLIPKNGDLKQLKYWRPISLLCNDYKILTNILAIRLKTILPQIISKEQACSIPNRTIFNNLFLIRDLITLNKEKNTNFHILQTDQEKAFDKVDHDFLIRTMKKLGFSQNFINFIQILYKNNKSYIINNGYLSSPIHLYRRLKQACPLSLPVYVIQSEITTINTNENENIIGIKIPNKTKQIKISQYADDSNFLIKTQQSATHILNYFEKLKKVTGSTMNFEKTKILPINTDQIQYLKQNVNNITILEQHKNIKILGIFFSENMKEMIETNWEHTLQKMENHIRKLTPRNLSLYGKTILINTLILAKTTFLSNILPIPE